MQEGTKKFSPELATFQRGQTVDEIFYEYIEKSKLLKDGEYVVSYKVSPHADMASFAFYTSYSFFGSIWHL
jgi:hypothetical protein